MSSPSPDPLIGRVIDGRYEIVERVARGGMATVYRAIDRRLDRVCALKVMHAHLSEGKAGAAFQARFRREARSAAALTHEGLVSVYDQGVEGDISYLTMEFVDGVDLRRYLEERGTLTLGETLDIAEQVLAALAVAHAAHLVHRDIKPENIMMTPSGRIKVADFGLARAITEVTATQTGTVLGTVAYLGPEVITSGASDARTDVYAVGVLAYEMLLGSQPHKGDSPIQIAYQHVHTDIPVPSASASWIPTEVDDLIAAFAARDPDARPSDAEAALAMLRSVRHQLSDDQLGERFLLADTPAWDSMLATTAVGGSRTTVIKSNRPGTTMAFPIGSGDVPPVPPPEPAPKRRAKKESPTTPTPTHGQRPKRRRRWPIVLSLLLVAAGLGGWYWYAAYGPGAMVAVPSGLVQVQEGVAKGILDEHDIAYVTAQANDDVVGVGLVISVNPPEGSEIKRTDTVTVTVSLGPLMYDVPAGLVGMVEGDALAALANAKITTGESAGDYSDTVPSGTVLSVSSGDATQVRHDTVVSLTVSQGPAPVTIPDLSGMDASTAQSTVEGEGLVYAAGTDDYSETIPKGQVLTQDPAPGTDGHRTDTVTVAYSLGHAPVTIPETYFGQNADAAKSKLEALGFTVVFNEPYGVSPFNQVLTQSAAKGDVVPYGSTITLDIF